MTPRQRSLGRLGGIVAVIASSLAIGAVVWRPAAEATGLATQRWTARTISDSIHAHRMDDQQWRDSAIAQLRAIRCNIDSAYRAKFAIECAWRVSQ